ncbi:MAG: hypothetical protein ACFBSD_01775 [Paracoccaceae bacterium]
MPALIYLLVKAAAVPPLWVLLQRAGINPYWALAALLPFGVFVLLYVLAFGRGAGPRQRIGG